MVLFQMRTSVLMARKLTDDVLPWIMKEEERKKLGCLED